MNHMKIFDLLSSRKTALFLLGALIILSITGMLIPQNSPVNIQAYQSWVSANPKLAQFFDRIGLTRLFSSPVFLLISLLFFISTLLCTIKQILVVRRTLKVLPVINPPVAVPIDLGILTGAGQKNTVETISSLLKRGGYLQFNFNPQEGLIRAGKYNFGYWGSVILHLGLLIILVGALISGQSKMEGYIYLGEGQTITEETQAYWQLKEGPWFSGHKGFSLTLDKIKIAYPQKELPYTTSLQLTIRDQAQQLTRKLSGNENLNYKRVKFFPDLRGYAVALVFVNEQDQVVSSGFYHLQTFWPTSGEDYRLNKYLPELGLNINVNFFPDYRISKGILSTKTWRPIRPALKIVVDRGGKVAYQGPLELKGKVKVGDYLLYFPEYRNNQGFRVVSDQGTPIIFAGFWTGALGMVLIYLFYPRQIWIKIEESPHGYHLLLWGRAQKFPRSFDEEIRVLADRLIAVTKEKGEPNVL